MRAVGHKNCTCPMPKSLGLEKHRMKMTTRRCGFKHVSLDSLTLQTILNWIFQFKHYPQFVNCESKISEEVFNNYIDECKSENIYESIDVPPVKENHISGELAKSSACLYLDEHEDYKLKLIEDDDTVDQEKDNTLDNAVKFCFSCLFY